MKRTDRTWGYEPRKRAEPTPLPPKFIFAVAAIVLAGLFLATTVQGAWLKANHAHISAAKGY